ncbi:MAG: helix-turn-helix domain-containing protein [Fibrobacter sp.]|nr:helix-turn-helix domain-containing protein [Fibrobacter sp.]MBR6449698.1 helix-turn-helix domain-containing protein [Fibrobacter sp.]
MDDNSRTADFHVGINGFLARKKIGQADLARRVGTSPANVNKWCKGEGVPSWELCRRLAMLGMTFREIFGPGVGVRVKTSSRGRNP